LSEIISNKKDLDMGSDRYFFVKYLDAQAKREECIKNSMSKVSDTIILLDTKLDMLKERNDFMLKVFKWFVGLMIMMLVGVFLLVGIDLTGVVFPLQITSPLCASCVIVSRCFNSHGKPFFILKENEGR